MVVQISLTNKLDGLLNGKDIADRKTLMVQCRSCRKWTPQPNYSFFSTDLADCRYCKLNDYDRSSAKSIRTFRMIEDNKRKPK